MVGWVGWGVGCWLVVMVVDQGGLSGNALGGVYCRDSEIKGSRVGRIRVEGLEVCGWGVGCEGYEVEEKVE